MAKTKAISRMESGRIFFLPLGLLRSNPAQPRRIFDADGLEELAQSIRQFGILQPLTVRRAGEGYELVAGERRLRAAKLAGLTLVPCILMNLDDAESGLVALIENLQRRDLDYIEEAEGIARLLHRYGLTQEQAAQRLGKSPSALSNKLRLLQHSDQVLQQLRTHRLSERHARALLRLPEEADRLEVLRQVVQGQLSVAATEALIQKRLADKPPARRDLGPMIAKDLRLFFNSLDHHLQLIRSAGIDAETQRRETDREIVLTIRIPRQGTGEKRRENG